TLRDGTQGTGISFSTLDKIRVAERLDQFGVHYIEGGWPGSNPKDAAFFQEAAKRTWKTAKITAFGMTRRGKMKVEEDPQVQMLLDAQTPVVTIVGKTWPLHVTEVFQVSLEENLAMIADTVAYLKSHGREVLYDAEHFFDSFREDPDYSLKTVKAANDAGADLVVLCETNGGALPEWVEEVTRKVIAYLGKPVGIHTHNDGGVGVANALAAVRAGANQVQGTINGYGERVGNCNLITVMPNLQIKMGIDLGIDLTKLRDLAHFVDELANVQHDIRAPYVGVAAFTHKGGLHVHAVQKLARTYEHVDPSLVGNERIISISDMSGQSNVLVRAEALGFKFAKGAPEVQAILAEVKRMESEGYEFEAAEASFEMLIRKHLKQYTQSFELIEYHSAHRRRGGPQGFETCEATIKLRVDGELAYTVDEGDGPVNALDNALRKALTPHFPSIAGMSLADYKVRIIDSGTGTAAKTRVLVVSTDGVKTWGTVGVSTNIIDASWEALVDSIDYFLLQNTGK
ncbi:MAG: 2-isopropylmalate synthase, partial [Verrucomicrobiaceae bacterium]|nr:2-isopropylmalate synthase [Verrucomicrobiaceae bacterium]